MRRLSQTQIRTFQTCPMKWKLSYIDRRKEPPAPPLTFGSAVHSGLETFYRNRIAEPAPLEEVLRAFDDELDPDAYDTAGALERARADGHAMLESWYRKHSLTFQPAMAVELALKFSIDDVPMISILDRVDVTDTGRLRITDYKTGKFFLKEKAQESEQLTLYQIAAEAESRTGGRVAVPGARAIGHGMAGSASFARRSRIRPTSRPGHRRGDREQALRAPHREAV